MSVRVGVGRAGRQSAIVGAVALLVVAAGHVGGAQSRGLEIRTLSSRPDLVSGGDVVVEVARPGGADGALRLLLNGRDVTSMVTRDSESGRHRGLVSVLTVGANLLQATLGRATARLTLTNHPLTGPLLSGRHLTPYECNTVQSGLGEPLDAHCTAPARCGTCTAPRTTPSKS